MKSNLYTLAVVLLLCLITGALAQNNVDAQTPEDVQAFRTLHANDVAVLFFHNSNDNKQTGFFESIFGLFGNNEDLDEQYQALIAQKYPIIEIDSKIPALAKVPDDYEVQTMPYIIAYYKNKELWREIPSKQSATIIENLIREQAQGYKFTFENTTQRDASSSRGSNAQPTSTSTKTVTSTTSQSVPPRTYGTVGRPATISSTTSSTVPPAGYVRSTIAPPTTSSSTRTTVGPTTTTSTTTTTTTSGTATGQVEVVDPFDETKRYKVDAKDYYNEEYNHMAGPKFKTISEEPVLETTLGPRATTVPYGYGYSGEFRGSAPVPTRSVVRDNLQYTTGAAEVVTGPRSYVRGGPTSYVGDASAVSIPASASGNRASIAAKSTQGATVTSTSASTSSQVKPVNSGAGLTVRTYDADSRK